MSHAAPHISTCSRSAVLAAKEKAARCSRSKPSERKNAGTFARHAVANSVREGGRYKGIQPAAGSRTQVAPSSGFGFSHHSPLARTRPGSESRACRGATRHCISNRHKRGLEIAVTPFASTKMSFLIATDLGRRFPASEQFFGVRRRVAGFDDSNPGLNRRRFSRLLLQSRTCAHACRGQRRTKHPAPRRLEVLASLQFQPQQNWHPFRMHMPGERSGKLVERLMRKE
jgi:hypothetical protein